MPDPNRNLDLLELAAGRLAPLLDRIVFLGGATTGVFITDPAAPGIRSTLDVDVIVVVAHHGEYTQLETQLRDLGFGVPVDKDAPICRWQHGDLLVDMMPTDEKILGFSNRWYNDSVSHSVSLTLESGRVIRHVTAPYFVATKLEAFETRGGLDFYASHDFEDVIAVIDGRPELLNEVRRAPDDLRSYVSGRMAAYLNSDDLVNALPGVVLDYESRRVDIVLARMREIADIN